MRRLLQGALATWRRCRLLWWTCATRLRLRWSGMSLELETGHAPPRSMPRVRIGSESGSGGRLIVRLGDWVRFADGVEVEVRQGGDNVLELGDQVRVSSGTAFKLRRGSVAIGPRTVVRDGVILKCSGRLSVGADCTLSYYSVYHCQEQITLEDHVGVGEHSSIVDSGHDVDGSDVPWTEQPAHSAPVHVGRNTMIYANVIVLRGTRIGPNSIVSTGALVRGAHEAGAVLAGSPAEVVKVLSAP